MPSAYLYLLLVKLFHGKTNKPVMCHAEPGIQDSKNSMGKRRISFRVCGSNCGEEGLFIGDVIVPGIAFADEQLYHKQRRLLPRNQRHVLVAGKKASLFVI